MRRGKYGVTAVASIRAYIVPKVVASAFTATAREVASRLVMGVVCAFQFG